MREFLGLDTSNYTTSCAIFDAENGTVRQAKNFACKAGMAGLRQSDAVFHHTRQLPEVIQTLLPNPPQNLTGIGVTTDHAISKDHICLAFCVEKQWRMEWRP